MKNEEMTYDSCYKKNVEKCHQYTTDSKLYLTTKNIAIIEAFSNIIWSLKGKEACQRTK